MISTPILIAIIITFLINIPFGYWRAHSNTMKSRKEWVLAVHLPVPIIFLLRIYVSATYLMIPLFVLAFFTGQKIGSLLYTQISEQLNQQSRCLFMDVKKYFALNTQVKY